MKRTLVLLLAATFGCAAEPAAGPVSSRAPSIGKADSTDAADHACRVVLSHAARVDDGSPWLAFEGELAVDASAPAGAAPAVLYRGADGAWWEVAAEPTGETAAGFTRHRFRIDAHTIAPDAGDEALAAFRLRFVPFVTAGGTRWFDHNLNAGDFDDYELAAAGAITVDPETAGCNATLAFTADWQELQTGALVRGRRLTVQYDPARLPHCRGTKNGYPAWELRGAVRFLPGGQLVEGTLKAHHTAYGWPLPTFDPVPLVADVPGDATSAELWFHNFGLWCDAWDSDYGRNYRFDVVAPPF